MSEKSPAPPGAFVEIGLEDIDEGKLVKAANAKLKKAFRDTLEYEKETSDKTAKFVMNIEITCERMPNSEELWDISYKIPTKIPTATRATFAKEVGGKLLAQPAGTNEDTPDQQLFYDNRGAIIGGEPTPIKSDIAGRIPAVAQ